MLVVAVSVGLDNFAASIALGLRGIDQALRVRTAVVFGMFESGMPVIGLLVGHSVAGVLGSSAHYIAGGVLIAAGAQIAFESIRRRDGAPALALAGAPLRQMVLLGAGLSLDNLVVGFALGTRNVSLVLAIVAIGVVSVGLSLVGLELGSRLGERVERGSEFLAAAVLAGVGLAIVLKLL